KKRAALARALVLDPDVIFFDEPTTGLDPITSAELDRLILNTRAAFGTTMIIVTHDLDTAFHCSDRLVMLEKGKVVASGTPSELRAIETPNVVNFIERRAERVEEVPVSIDEFMTKAGARAAAAGAAS